MSNRIVTFCFAALTATAAGCASDVPFDPATRSTPAFAVGAAQTDGALLAQLRQASARFHDIQVALDEGYVQAVPACTPGFGYAFRNPALFDGVVDPDHPELLLYEPQRNGDLQLVAVELLVVAAPWDATHTGPPSYAGYTFEDRRAAGSAGPPFPNYALHVWVWRHNPNGLITPFNPTVSCEFAS